MLMFMVIAPERNQHDGLVYKVNDQGRALPYDVYIYED